MNKRIFFTGGGSAGHVTPNLALIKKFQTNNWEIFYIGSKTGIEKELIGRLAIPYFPIASGKLRRYFCLQNFIDPAKIIYGIIQAFLLCRKVKPAIVFSKGGFVAFPVVLAAWLHRIPVIVHESDLTPGLANKLSFPFATKICLTFSETQKYLKNTNKIIITGTPIREDLLSGDPERGRQLCGFTNQKKILLVVGGSLGAQAINNVLRELLPQLLPDFQIIHICGKDNYRADLDAPGYKQFTYLHHEFGDILACSNIVISRAGANSIYELLALGKPNILIPLSKLASRGDQIVNAKYFAELGFSQLILEESLNPEKLREVIYFLRDHEAETITLLKKFKNHNAIEQIYAIIITSCK